MATKKPNPFLKKPAGKAPPPKGGKPMPFQPGYRPKKK